MPQLNEGHVTNVTVSENIMTGCGEREKGRRRQTNLVCDGKKLGIVKMRLIKMRVDALAVNTHPCQKKCRVTRLPTVYVSDTFYGKYEYSACIPMRAFTWEKKTANSVIGL